MDDYNNKVKEYLTRFPTNKSYGTLDPKKIKIKFYNDSNEKIDIYWIDHYGNEKLYFTDIERHQR